MIGRMWTRCLDLKGGGHEKNKSLIYGMLKSDVGMRIVRLSIKTLQGMNERKG
jgi:hypothetical protein